MPELLKKVWTAPRFVGDEEKTRRAELLHILSWAAAVVVLLYALASAVAGNDVVPRRSGLVLLVVPVLFGVQWLMRRGHIRLSSWLFCLVLFAIPFDYAVITPEYRGVAVDSSIVVVMVAGLLLGFRVAWGFAALSVYANMALWFAGVDGKLPGPPIESGFFTFVGLHLGLVFAAFFVLYLAIKSLERALASAQAESLKRQRSDSLLRRMSQVVEQSPSTVAITDTEGNLEYVNPAFTRITGYAADEVLGQNPRLLNSGTHSRAFYRDLWDTIRAGEEWRGEFVNRKKDGSHYWELASISALRDDGGRITHFIKVAEDITRRKRAEQDLRDSERQYHTTVDAIRDPVHVVDVDLRLMLCNQALLEWTDMLGLQCDIIGENLFDAFPVLSDEAREEYRIAIETGEIVSTEETMQVGGRTFVTETRKIPIIEDGNVVRIVTVLHDVTARVQAEQALRRSEGKFRHVIEQSTDAIILTDEQGNIIEWNRGAEQLTGLSDREVLHRPVWEIRAQLSAETEDAVQLAAEREMQIRSVLETGQASWLHQMREVEIRRTDGTQRTAQSVMFSIHTEHGFQMAGILRDVTERQRTERALIESLVRYRMLFENANDAIFIMDHDRFVECNPQALAMYGYAKDQILKKTPFDLSPPVQPDGRDSRDKALELIHLALQGHPQRFDWRYLREDGVAFDVDVSLNRIVISGQEFLQAIVHDITARVRAEVLVQRRLEIERVVSFISSSFVENADLSTAMAVSLEEMGRFSGADHVYVFRFNAAMTQMSNTYEWCGEGVTPQIDALQNFDLGIFAWLVLQFQRDEPVYVPDIAQLPRNVVDFKMHLEARAVKSILAVPIVIKNRLHGFLELDNVARPRTWSEDDYALLRVVAENLGNALERSYAEEALHIRDWAIASAINGVALADLAGSLTYVNNAFLMMWGYQDRKHVLGRSIVEFWEQPELAGAILGALSDYGSWSGESVGRRKDGTLFDVQISASLILANQGEPLGIMVSFIDITERKRMDTLLRTSLREKEVLLQEIHHRVNTNMQIIHSLLNIQASSVEDVHVRDMLRESQNRIRSMALVHEKLYRSPSVAQIDMGEYVRSLSTHLFQSYQVKPDSIHLQVDVPSDVSFGLNVAIPCGLILTELISNALKHAFPYPRPSQIDTIYIGLRPVQQRFELVVNDNGVGLPADFDFLNSDSLGLQLVHIWVEQLDAKIELGRDGGTMFRLTFEKSSRQELENGQS